MKAEIRLWLLIVIIIGSIFLSAGCMQRSENRLIQQQENPVAGTGNSSPVQNNVTVAIPAGEYNAGYTVLLFNYTGSDGRSKSLTTAVWYPTDKPAARYSYGRNGLSGEVSADAEPSGRGPFPLVIFSHGYGGCGLQSTFFTEELARHGYVVAAPDHDDALMCSITPGQRDDTLAGFDLRQFADPKNFTDTSFIDRRDDIRALIDGFLRLNTEESSMFHGIINPSEIGMSGHSLGGYTTMGVVGGWNSWLDPRIKAALMFSPYIQPYLVNGNPGAVHVPLMYQGGTADIGITPFVRMPGGAYDRSNPPKYFIDMTGASHMDWSNLVCTGDNSISGCLASNEKARVIDAYGIMFLDRYLKGETGVPLAVKDPALSEYRYKE